MNRNHDRIPSLSRTSSSCKNKTNDMIVSNYISTSTSFIIDPSSDRKPLVERDSPVPAFSRFARTRSSVFTLLRSIFSILTIPTLIPTCIPLTLPTHLRLTPSPGRKVVTGTLFGNRRGLVSFAVQYDPRSDPFFIVELSISTSALVKEMSSGLVRIALECEKRPAASGGGGGAGDKKKLFHERKWTMYCNGRKCGHALARECTESDWRLLRMVQSVSVGAGVIPVVEEGMKSGGGGVAAAAAGEGELLYMRARFERVVGNRDSEAFYMMNPDGNGGPELSIFLLRL